jgi:ATP-dependent DNA ligase
MQYSKEPSGQAKAVSGRSSKMLEQILSYPIQLHTPVPPKKPSEYAFDKTRAESFGPFIALGNTLAEKKSDGYCVLVSIDRSRDDWLKMFTSRSNELNPLCFPDVTADLAKLPSGYYHGELVGLNPGKDGFTNMEEFSAISNRAIQNADRLTPELLEQYPLKIDFFDILMHETKPMLSTPFSGRRQLLEKIIGDSLTHAQLIPEWKIEDAAGLQKLYLEMIGNDKEGLIVKNPDSLYLPGSANRDWIKLKEFTTLDLAVLGLYETPESRSAGKPFSAILCCPYNQETEQFETLVKVKVDKIDEQQKILGIIGPYLVPTESFDKLTSISEGILALNPAMAKIERKIPARMVRYSPESEIAVAEVKVLDVTFSENWHSCGYSDGKAHSARIASYVRLRDDKTRREDATSTRQIKEFYAGL